MKKLLLICIVLSCGYFGCGSTDGALSTSSVTATIDTLTLDSDAISWFDASDTSVACNDGIKSSIPAPDSVNLTVVSKVYSNTGTMGLPVRIDSAVISYVPADDGVTKPMSSIFQPVGMTIASGATVSLPVRVVTTEQKILFAKLPDTLACTAPLYHYYTKITLNITEIGTDRKSFVDASLDLRLSDYLK